jgi:hypothetical protein
MNTQNPLPNMSRKANALDNVCIENFFTYLKTKDSARITSGEKHRGSEKSDT